MFRHHRETSVWRCGDKRDRKKDKESSNPHANPLALHKVEFLAGARGLIRLSQTEEKLPLGFRSRAQKGAHCCFLFIEA